MAAAKPQVAGRERRPRAAEAAREARGVSTTGDGQARAVAVARGEVTPGGLFALQRRIGNRATVALLQRDLEDEDVEAAAAMFQQAEAEDSATYLPLEWNVKNAAKLGPERAAKLRQMIEARAAPKKDGLGEEDVEAAASVFQKEESGPGAARGRKALQGLVAESSRYNRGIDADSGGDSKPKKQSLPMVWNVKLAAELGPETAAKYRKLFEAQQARQKKTATAGGAFVASQVNSKEKIGSAAAYTTPAEREGHLGEFLRGSHAFVPHDAYLKIRGQHVTEANFNAWGAGTNFVAPLAAADKLVAEASADGGRGLFHLEEALGIPPMSWVKQCKEQDYGIWRFKNPQTGGPQPPHPVGQRVRSLRLVGGQRRRRPSRGVAPRR